VNLQTIFDASSDRLIDQAISSAVTSITHAWGEGREAQIVLTGGRTGCKIAQALDLGLDRAIRNLGKIGNQSVESSKKIHIWFSDERFVELESPDRTDATIINEFKLMASYLVFHRVLTPSQIDNQANGLTTLAKLDLATTDYSQQLSTTLSGNRFDCVILSMGEDGHVASCFPGQDEILNSKNSAAAVSNSPKPPSDRVTITLHQLAQTLAIYIFVLGSEKATPLKAVQDRADSAVVEQLRQNSPVGQIYLLTDQK